MISLLEMPRGGEWLVILAVVVLLFGPTKLPGLVRQLGKSKKIWDEEIATGKDKPGGELTQDAQAAEQVTQPPLPATTPQLAQESQPGQADGQAPGDSLPPTHTAR